MKEVPDFAIFVDARYRDLVDLARRLSRDDMSNAEDVVQEALIKTAGRWESIEEPYAYARAAVTRSSIDRHRWLSRRFQVERDPSSDEHANERGDLVADLVQRDEIMAALRSLPLLYQQVLVLRYFEGLTEDEVANLLKRPIGSVKSAAHRGLRRLRELMDPTPSTTEKELKPCPDMSRTTT